MCRNVKCCFAAVGINIGITKLRFFLSCSKYVVNELCYETNLVLYKNNVNFMSIFSAVRYLRLFNIYISNHDQKYI